ncbi:MAG: hypothetical protein ACRDYB_03440 [Acidimicrobiales bacterium]
MSGYTAGPGQCEVFQDELAELALGTLSGRSRSESLEHVASCPRCAAELEQLSIVADKLLQLAPEIEPPLGFELRLAHKLQVAAMSRRPRRFRRASVLAAAAAILVVLGGSLGALVSPRGSNAHNQSATASLSAANLTSHGNVLGKVVVSAGSPAWMFVTISGATWSGKVTCDVTLAGGKIEKIGAFKVSGRYGAWDAPLQSPADEVRSARLIASNGTTLASAQLQA